MKNSSLSTSDFAPMTLEARLQATPPALRTTVDKVDLSKWNEVAYVLFERLREDSFTDKQSDSRIERRIHGFYLPVLFWCMDQIERQRGPTLIGLNAPQGAGKTTLTHALTELMPLLRKRALTVSIDDFYLTRNEQVALANSQPQNPYLQARGYPGTHDISLGARVLTRLKSLEVHESIYIPGYDKSAHGGLGDRKPESEWKRIQGPVDVIFLEGWMLGFLPQQDQLSDPHLRGINRLLHNYTAWHEQLDAFLFLSPQNPLSVLDWRVEAEEKMKASGRPGLSREAIEAYVKTFLPAYETYLPQLKHQLPVPADRALVLEIGHDRLPTR